MNPFQTLKSNFSKIFNPPKKTVTPSIPSFATPTPAAPTIGPMPFIGPRQPTPTVPSITPTGGGLSYEEWRRTPDGQQARTADMVRGPNGQLISRNDEAYQNYLRSPGRGSIRSRGGGSTPSTTIPQVNSPTNNFSTDNAYREAYKVQQAELIKLFNDAGIPEIIDPVKQPELVRQKHDFLSQYGWGMDKTGKTYSLSDQGRSASDIANEFETRAGQGAPGGDSSPVTPNIPPEAQKAVEIAEKAVQDDLKISPDELSTQGDLDRLIESVRKGFSATKDQAIPMEFITGQLSSIERRALDMAQPLEAKLARLQAARTASLEASKFALDRADKEVAYEREAAEAKRTGGFTLGKDQVRYDDEGNIIAVGGGFGGAETGAYTPGADPNADAYADAVLSGKTKLENIPEEYRGAVAQAITGQQITPETSPYLAQIAVNGRQAVKGLSEIANRNHGIFGKTAAVPWPDALRGDDFRNYKAQLDYLKGNIIPAALTAMRNASSTGGALGQVSDREGAWLASSLGALEMTQSPDMIIKQLKLIDESLSRWEKAVNQYGETSASETGDGGIFDF